MHKEPTGDELLDRLGALAREEAVDPRLEDLVAGRLSPEDQAALAREAADDPELAEALAAYTPLDAAAQSRIADHLFSQVIPKTSTPSTPERAEGAKVLPFRRPVARVLMAVVPLAAAAALAFFLLRPEAPTGAPVPAYGLTVEGGEKRLRSDQPTDGPARLLPATRLRLVLTPAAPAESPVAVRAWQVRAGQATPWAVTPRIAPNGAALVEGTAEGLGLAGPPGRLTLVLAVGRAEHLPPTDADAARLAAPEDDRFRVLTTEVELLAP